MARMTKLHASDCHACEHYLNSCMKSVSARSNSRKTPGVSWREISSDKTHAGLSKVPSAIKTSAKCLCFHSKNSTGHLKLLTKTGF